MSIKQAYEVYSLVGGGYNKRLMYGFAWTKDVAYDIGMHESKGRRFHVGVVHLIEINGRWHRVNVHPVENVFGDVNEAETSRIEKNDLPERKTPSIQLRVGNGEAIRITLNLEKAIDIVAGVHSPEPFTLFTYRQGGLLPITFYAKQLREDDKIQRLVFDWLKYEIEARQ